MKHIKYYIIALLALPLMAACSEDDYNAPTPTGNPVMSYSAPTTAVWMGEEVEVKVDCKDEAGVALSTLKANLLFSGQSVDATTIRTKEPGEYLVKLKVPYVQSIPDGKVDIQLTLQMCRQRQILRRYHSTSSVRTLQTCNLSVQTEPSMT